MFLKDREQVSFFIFNKNKYWDDNIVSTAFEHFLLMQMKPSDRE